MKRSVKNLRSLFMLFIGILMIQACSSGSDESQAFSNKDRATQQLITKDADGDVDPVLQGLYVKMLESESYIRFDNAAKAFSDKIGDEIPESETVSGDAILNWISGNISKTEFIDFNEVSSEYDNLLALATINLENNMGFFNYLGGTRPGTLLPILIPAQPQPDPTSCPTCVTSYKSCTSAADNAYASSIENASSKLTKGLVSESQFLALKAGARIDWDKAYGKCTRSFNACCNP